jgi:hypothetical protein
MKLVRTLAILPFLAASDLTGKSGHFVTVSAAGAVDLPTTATQAPFGLALTDAPVGEPVSVALSRGGLAGTVRVKLAGPVPIVGALLALQAGGRVIADPGAGARVLVAQAVETGVADELIEAVLIAPISLT